MTDNADCYISVDVETAGPIPGDYSMLSIGACLVSDPTKAFYVEIQPTTMNAVPEAIAVTGMSLEHLKESGQSPMDAVRAFATWIRDVCQDSKPVFVGFNASFDWSFVNWYFTHFLGSNPFGIGGVDIKSYYMGLAGVDWSETRSSQLPEEYRRASSASHTHNARDDAVEQAHIFAVMMTEAASQQ